MRGWKPDAIGTGIAGSTGFGPSEPDLLGLSREPVRHCPFRLCDMMDYYHRFCAHINGHCIVNDIRGIFAEERTL
jgi:hypothetical protein